MYNLKQFGCIQKVATMKYNGDKKNDFLLKLDLPPVSWVIIV